MKGLWSKVRNTKVPQLAATDVQPSAGQSEIHKQTQIITGGNSVEAKINRSKYLRVVDVK